MTDYSNDLLTNYSESHSAYLDTNDESHQEWFEGYFSRHYMGLLPLNKEVSILEIGCNKGFLLSVLKDSGFGNLTGVDMDSLDVETSKLRVGTDNIFCGNYLDINFLQKFDVIIIKAVLEHVPKDQTMKMLEKIKCDLVDGGVAIIDVPNMDWLFASHERYMDFTHETGFTNTSLHQVCSRFFDHVTILPADHLFKLRGVRKLLNSMLRKFVYYVLKVLDPEGGANPIFERGIIAVCKKNSITSSS
jgi:SAM-dependent methyltransferase